ncbi:phosphotransferase [Vibrio sp.]|nr:phosphotransferase [Vibrio sp.]
MTILSWKEACRFDASLFLLSEQFFQHQPISSHPITVQSLEGGLTNRCWLINSTHASWVWRPTTEVSKGFGISRKREYQILSLLDSFPLSPKAVWLNDQGLLVEWLNGHSFDTHLPQHQRQKVVVDALYSLHQFTIPSLKTDKSLAFDYVGLIHRYYQSIPRKLVTSKLKKQMALFSSLPKMNNQHRTLCHIDMGMHNLIDATGDIKIIDWEYSAYFYPQFDIAMACSYETLNVRDTVSQYVDKSEKSELPANLNSQEGFVDDVLAWRPYTDFIGYLWYLCAAGLYQNDDYIVLSEELRARL